MLDGFNDVPTFVAVVEAGGFAAAAKRLNLSRSAVGKAVGRLELRLGVRLFHRTTRSTGLTDEGHVFLERCERAMAELRAGVAALESGRSTASGRLRVSMPVLFGRLRVAPVLLRLADQHPALELELEFNDRHVDLIADGFDLCVRNGPVGQGAGLMVRRIACERTLVCAAPAYLERHGAPATLDDFPAHCALVYSRAGRAVPWRFPRGRETFTTATPPSRLLFDDLGTMLDAAIAGHGLAWLPDWLIADRLAEGTLVQLLADVPSLSSNIHAIWPEAPQVTFRVRLALEELAAQAAQKGARTANARR